MKSEPRNYLFKGALGVAVLGAATLGAVTLAAGHQQAPTAHHKKTITSAHKIYSSKKLSSSQIPITKNLPWTFPSVSNVGNGNPALPLGNYVEHLPGDGGPNGRVNGPPWSGPHYVLQVTSSSGQQIAGEIHFIFEDGRVGPVFAISGVLSAANNLATLVTGPTIMTPGYASPASVTKGTTIQAPVNNRSITLDGCQNYLHWLSPAGGAPPNLYQDNPYECTFVYMGSSILYN